MLAVISYLTGDLRATVMICVMVMLGIVLRFVQESARRQRRRKAQGHGQHHRHGVRGRRKARRCRCKELVPGDVVQLSAGRHGAGGRAAASGQGPVRQPGRADRRVHAGGEDRRQPAGTTVHRTRWRCPTSCFLGTNVESGTATAVVVQTGRETYFGSLASSIVGSAQ